VEYRQVGDSELTVSVIGLGCNNFGGSSSSDEVPVYGVLGLEQTRAVVDAAYDCGVTFFDTADVYGNGGSERFLGEILRDRRDSVVLGTKWGSGAPPGVPFADREHVRAALHGSLDRLGTDHVDLYQLHWPDPLVPWEETLGALGELVDEGKVRALGSSHLSGAQVLQTDELARSRGLGRFVAAQNEYSLLKRGAEAELLPACRAAGVGLLAYFPLASGLLTGKYRRDAPAPTGTRLAGRELDDEMYGTLEALTAFAAERGHTLLELAVGAVAARPGVSSVLTGATSPGQIVANAAAGSWQLSPADLAALDAL
jgi:aryl-alcohol dehydrogenase-like predicted oxidoreductase